VAGSCEYGDEPSGSGATELVLGMVSKLKDDLLRHMRNVTKHVLPLDPSTANTATNPNYVLMSTSSLIKDVYPDRSL
jgi:hypothetical protein